MAQIPRGEENLFCPFWQKPMSEVCHKCPMWVQLRGKDPQSEQEVDSWGCSIMWIPKLLIENSQMSRQTGAAVESFRNEMVAANDLNLRLMRSGVSLIEGEHPKNGT